MQELERLAVEYIRVVDSGDTGEQRTEAHNAFMDELRTQWIEYEDREHAARIARAIVTLSEVGLHLGPPPHSQGLK